MHNKIFVPTDGDDPKRVIVGTVQASLRLVDDRIILVGDESEIRGLCEKEGLCLDRVLIVHCPDSIPMDAIVGPDILDGNSSLVTAAMMAKEQGGGFTSSGHTGAMYIIATLGVGTIPGIKRPGLMVPIPNMKGSFTALMDAGGMVDCRPPHLFGFSRLTNSYCKIVWGVERPAITLLSNGTERGKGDKRTKETYLLLEEDKAIHFAGNIEGTELLTGRADAIVTDGFAGNVALKVAEGVAKVMVKQIIEQCGADHPLVAHFRKQLDHRQQGGAVMLGCSIPFTKTHGVGDEIAVENGIIHLSRLMDMQLIEKITPAISPE